MSSSTPCSLYSLLSVHLILERIAAHLRIRDLYALSATSIPFCVLIRSSPAAWRRLDMQHVKGVLVGDINIDIINEKKEAYAQTGRYPLSMYRVPPLEKLKSFTWDLLEHVRILILDTQFVDVSTLSCILLDPKYHVRLLSLIKVHGLNQAEFLELLVHFVNDAQVRNLRRTLVGIYYFNTRADANNPSRRLERKRFESERNLHPIRFDTPRSACRRPRWYRLFCWLNASRLAGLNPELIRATSGVIAWDAVLCRGPRHALPGTAASSSAFASDVLDPEGCAICHSSPEGPGIMGDQLPMRHPPPLYATSAEAAREPTSGPESMGEGEDTPLRRLAMYEPPLDSESGKRSPFFARCFACLEHRWCMECGKWWCENCYEPGAPESYFATGAAGSGTRVSNLLYLPSLRACSTTSSSQQQ